MRILIANDFDDSVALKRDVRAWTHRILWLARDHDVVVMVTEPEPAFLAYVARHTGLNVSTLRVHVLPSGRFSPGRYGQYMFDTQALLDPDFIDEVKRDAGAVNAVFALWPGAHVARFAYLLGLANLFPGAAFIAQNGGEIANNKANFRAFAAAADVRTCAGAVARTRDDAILHSRHLLASTPTIMLKKAHAAAGAGNIILTRERSLDADHSGGKFLTVLDAMDSSLAAFWKDRWDWLSSDGRYGVVLESYLPGARSVFVEFDVRDDGAMRRQTGELVFRGRSLTVESVPLGSVDAETLDKLQTDGLRLATYYHALGYRGLLCADALTSRPGELMFTEVNARASSSTHLYEGIAQFVGSDTRTISQYTTPSSWPARSLEQMVTLLEGNGLAYNPGTRSGVLCVVPSAWEFSHGQSVVAVVHDSPAARDDLLDRLERTLSER